MNKSLLSIISATLVTLFFGVTDSYAVKHVVNVQNYVFVPANLNVQVGDTIRWVWVNGSHTTTSTTIPFGAPSWDEPINSGNTSYEYRVTVAGVYNYLCTPHSNSQIGSFTATAPPPPTLSVTPSNQNVTSSGGSTNFTVTSNSNWTASSNAAWCTVTPSGSGNGTIVANYQANSTTNQRIANITVTVSGLPAVIVTVTQTGAAATLSVTPSNQNVTAVAGSTNFTVSSNSNWTASSSAGWCSVTSSGSGNGVITATYQENTTNTTRIATITVTVSGLPSSIVTVTQAGAVAQLNVTPANQSVTNEAGVTSFTVSSNTTWTAISSNDWCVVTPSGSGNGTITATYDENTAIDPRVATITVTAGGTVTSIVTVSQAGVPAVLMIDPVNQDVTAVAGATSFNVTSNTTWEVTTDATWVTTTTEGSGSGSLDVSYEENSSNEVRIAMLTITASDLVQMVTVTQEGSIAAGNIEVNQVKVYPNPGNGVLNVTSSLKALNTAVWIVDMTGNTVKEFNTSSPSSFSIDSSGLSAGNYILNLEQDEKTYRMKITITK